MLDDTTTVIDGGNIITGTVTANKLNATDINASKTLTVGAMTDEAAATILNSEIQENIDDVADDATAAINKLAEDTAGSIANVKQELEGKINDVTGQLTSRATQKQFEEIDAKLTEWFGEDGYMNFSGSVLTIGKGNVDVAITGDVIAFRQNGSTVAYISSNKLHIPEAELEREFRMGNFVWKPIGGQLVLAYSPLT